MAANDEFTQSASYLLKILMPEDRALLSTHHVLKQFLLHYEKYRVRTWQILIVDR